MSEILRVGFTDGEKFRDNNRYSSTQRMFEQLGLVPELGEETPTVGINVVRLARMNSIQSLSHELTGQRLAVTILGISTAEGPRDFQRLLKALGAGHVSTTAIDISDGIFSDIAQTGLDDVRCLLKDARDTGLASGSQDIVFRDHLGNCCPPDIDRAIEKEAARILKPQGISIVNITTSDLLKNSPGRLVVPFSKLKEELGDPMIEALQKHVYDLVQLKQICPEMDCEMLRGMILGVEPEESFVVFGEDAQGHGEWFRTLDDHLRGWQENGLEVIEESGQPGKDSHEPKLECLRHNVVLRKIKNFK